LQRIGLDEAEAARMDLLQLRDGSAGAWVDFDGGDVGSVRCQQRARQTTRARTHFDDVTATEITCLPSDLGAEVFIEQKMLPERFFGGQAVAVDGVSEGGKHRRSIEEDSSFLKKRSKKLLAI
jgi:hypothetical protein